MLRGLAKKVALVTGGASGLGRAIAKRLLQESASVVITDVNDDLGRDAARADGSFFLKQDVTDESRWREVVDDIERRFGQLDILVNNAGILGSSRSASPENTELSQWKLIFAVNAEGVFLGCRAALPAMRRTGGGAIVNISSVAGLLATPMATAYGASKAVVRHLTKSVAQFCVEQRLNVRCNSVHPGNIRTQMWDKYAEETARLQNLSFERIVCDGQGEVPMGDFTLPEDVAAAVCFLASAESRHITGVELCVDGGIVHCDTFRQSAAH